MLYFPEVCILNEYLMIGTVLKPQGVRGECKIRSWASRIERFAKWPRLYVKTAEGFVPVSLRVRRIQDNYVYAFLNDSGTAEAAEKFRGVDLYIAREDAAPAEGDSNLIADLVGCTAFTESGEEVGTLTDVLQYGSVDTWVFKTRSGSLMAPALLSVFPQVDPENRKILVNAEKLEEVAVRS